MNTETSGIRFAASSCFVLVGRWVVIASCARQGSWRSAKSVRWAGQRFLHVRARARRRCSRPRRESAACRSEPRPSSLLGEPLPTSSKQPCSLLSLRRHVGVVLDRGLPATVAQRALPSSWLSRRHLSHRQTKGEGHGRLRDRRGASVADVVFVQSELCQRRVDLERLRDRRASVADVVEEVKVRSPRTSCAMVL
jgi:hypothetical protein